MTLQLIPNAFDFEVLSPFKNLVKISFYKYEFQNQYKPFDWSYKSSWDCVKCYSSKYLFLGSGERQYKLTTQKRKKPPSSLPNYRSNIDTCLIHFSTVARRLVFICFVGGIEVAFVLYLKYHNLKFILWQGFSCSMYHSLSSVEKEKYCIKQCN